ncbi:redoxin domain-containing protein [Paenibacillus validus]|uniref:Redoxin domain-containing protein n=1 Tax=Paenibacillus validus TaxID=44253 RepID=A0A7X2ZF29_9BACL|nr:redoxin domain-containing protein [Paenibacillus validus]MUG73755.1 redoxin domain-containing protein [Paenibacillus validus]
MNTWTWGPLVLHYNMLLIMGAIAAGYGVLHLRLLRRSDRGIVTSIAVNALLVWVLVWKLSLLLLDFRAVLENPMSLLYFNGGRRGVWLAWLLSAGYAAIAAEKRKIGRSVYIDSLAVSVLGGYAIFHALHFIMSGFQPVTSGIIGSLGAAAAIVWLRSPLPETHRASVQRLLVIAIGWVLVITVANGLFDKPGGPPAAGTAEGVPGLGVGQQAPDFELKLLNGETIRLSDYRGQTVFVNFWATWCPPCQAEMPYMQQFYSDYARDGVVILGVNATHTEASVPVVAAWVKEWKITFPIALDTTGDVTDTYRVNAYPATYVVDPGGVIREKHPGPMNGDMLMSAWEKITNKSEK